MSSPSILSSSLVPWLLAGALLASVYANFALYPAPSPAREGTAGTASPSQPDRLGGGEESGIPGYHLSPGNTAEHCPTLDKLGLSAKQREQIRKCSLTSLDLRTGLALEITAASEELHGLLAKDDVENSAVLALAEKISELRSKQFKAWIGSILVVREVLSPEQLSQLRKLESN